jgi:hypothetical protein
VRVTQDGPETSVVFDTCRFTVLISGDFGATVDELVSLGTGLQ